MSAGVILADPNWRYGNFGARKHGSPNTHYDTARADDIAAIPVSRWAKKDCVLLLYATWPKLPDAFRVAEGWGFGDYVTGIPWIKTVPSSGQIRTGIGFWNNARSGL